MKEDVVNPTIYRVGTLTYTRWSLIRLFALLILGDFGMALMGNALPKLLPLHLSAMGVDAGRMGWILSLGPLVSLFVSPFIGVWSDRLRTRWGRRRPFLLCSTPILSIGLLLIPHIHNYVLLCGVILIVQIANVMETVLFYLYADIVPPALMGRLMATFRMVSTLGALAFQWFLFPHFDTSPVLVWTVCGLVYLVSYQTAMLLVKEGKYPDPKKESNADVAKDYIRDGFCSKYIWILWLVLGMSAIATPAALFTDLISKKIFNIDMVTIGHMNAYATAISLVIMLPSGWLVDRFGPLVVWTTFCTIVGANNLAAYFWVKDASNMQCYYILNALLSGPMYVALMPMLYAHLPKAKFGQLVSTQSMVVQTLIFLSTNLLGQLIFINEGNYRIALLYAGPILMVTPIFAFFLPRVRNPFFGHEMALVRKNGVTAQA